MDKKLTIGVLIGNANSPHTQNLMKGIYEAAEKLDVNIMYFLGIHTSDYYHAPVSSDEEDGFDYQFNVVYDYAWLGKADALIISYGTLSIFLEDKSKEAFLARFKGIPYVMVEDEAEGDGNVSIKSDNYTGMYSIMKHLLEVHGYRRFTFLAGPDGNTDAAERKAAFVDACTTYGIAVEDSMIACGDYTACVEEQVNQLLDAHPDMQAMVCANDIMADTAYRECAKRGLVVGRDIAITGYDNYEVAENMIPPLTTVQQNGIHMGHTALQSAVDLCMGNHVEESVLEPALIKVRSSCGCGQVTRYRFPAYMDYYDVGIGCYAHDVAEIMVNHIMLAEVDTSLRKEIREGIEKAIRSIVEFFRTGNYGGDRPKKGLIEIIDWLKNNHEQYISASALTEMLSSYLLDMMKQLTEQDKIAALAELLNYMQKYIQSVQLKSGNDRLQSFQQDAWVMPLISRDMMNHIDNEKDFYRAAMAKLSVMQLKSAYLYLFERPIRHLSGEKWECPQQMYLASCFDGEAICAYEPKERPVISKERGFAQSLVRDDNFHMCVFALYSGETQYGILMCEIKIEDMALMYLASMQISIALHFYQLSMEQRETQSKLERLVEEVNEKNEILGFMSEYDELTGCLNRRGFMEKAVHHCHQSIGQRVMLLFADLDHLKEINDSFGHAAGDYAIQTVAQVLKSAVTSGSYVGRIGGDEFVAMIPLSEHVTPEEILQEIRQKNQYFNEKSDKPYYIEMSVGSTEFVCDNQIGVSAMMNEADHYLYDAKKNRRKSVKK